MIREALDGQDTEATKGKKPQARRRVDYLAQTSQRVRNAREMIGMTQAELAAIVGISQNSMSDIELGKTNIAESSEKLAKIAKALDVNLYWLIPWTGVFDPEPPKTPRSSYKKDHNTMEAQAASAIINTLPEEERRNCLSLLRTMKEQYEKQKTEYKNEAIRLLRRIEEIGGEKLRLQIQDEVGVFGLMPGDANAANL